MGDIRFPDGFFWGAATAAYQIEGAADTDGRGPSIWDTFSATPGATAHGHTGRIACDHYHRFGDDITLMKSLGLQRYRFSISWPRVQPDGSGPVNPAGLAFYDRLVDGLLEAGITPMATLYHWDLPQAVHNCGGWPARDTAYRFGEYATIVADRLADRVADWSTLNEPWCAAFLGYAAGIHAPGMTDPGASFAAAHHLLLGHGLAVDSLRAAGAESVSIVLNNSVVRGDPEAVKLVDGLANRVFTGPLFDGAYPSDVLEHAARFTDHSFIQDGDLDVISRPIDLLGLNYYNPTWVRRKAGAPGSAAHPGTEGIDFSAPSDLDRTAMGWPIDAGGLSDLLLQAHRDYGVPLAITENGAAFDDKADADGYVDDVDRVAFLDSHLRAVDEAITKGADVRGYLAWSLMDNFEWAEGYTKRFGIVRVDYDTGRRIPKASAEWYANVIRHHGLST
ncbi:GH1 family beta-glucosidase [Stackebrandtia soli]|uniref:GH1 family beta-glucosidase n=1 Tax=Stackebrandtia soli TaxID=1892856 RepID=UPI0039E927EE